MEQSLSDSFQRKSKTCVILGAKKREAHLPPEMRKASQLTESCSQARRKTRVRVRPQLGKAKSRRDCAAASSVTERRWRPLKGVMKVEFSTWHLSFYFRFTPIGLKCHGESLEATQRWLECGIANLTPQFQLNCFLLLQFHLNSISISPQFHLIWTSVLPQFHLNSNSALPQLSLNWRAEVQNEEENRNVHISVDCHECLWSKNLIVASQMHLKFYSNVS